MYRTHTSGGFRLDRRSLLKGTAATGAVALSARLPSVAPAGAQDSIVFLSSQLTPIAEAEAMRNSILSGFEGSVDFIPEDPGPFNDRVQAEAQAGSGEVSLIGGLHGDLSAFHADGLLMDLTDLVAELADRELVSDFLDLGKFGTESNFYVPWMQATYIMAARKEALEYLPEGVDEAALQTSLTYEQLGQWAANINDAEGPRFGLPASDDGLLHRFFQGYTYPSFTGGVNTTFASNEAVAMWEWLRTTWGVSDPQSVTYGTMSEPLLSGSVWVTWDHTARLIDALRQIPDDLVTFPAPIGPQGRGYMPVVAGLGIPNTAPNVEGARALIEYLTRPETQALTLQEVAFFPVVGGEMTSELDTGTQMEADAVQATTSGEDSLASVLPIGLGDQSGPYNTVFRNAFQAIILNEADIAETLASESANLQAVLDAAGASCWAPDPASDGVCQVG